MATAPKAGKSKKGEYGAPKTLVSGARIPFLRMASWPRMRLPGRRTITLIIAVVAGVIVTLQLLFPYDRALPLAQVGEKKVAWATQEELAKAITDQFDSSKIRLTLGNEKIKEVSVKSVGGEPDTEVMMKTVSDYPLWQRFIPGSIIWPTRMARELDVFYSDKPFQAFVETQAKEFSFAPQNARLEIKDEQVVAAEAQSGSQVKPAELKQAISEAILKLGKTTTLEVPSKRLAAERTSKDLAPVRQQAEAVLDHKVAISANGQSFSPDRATVASWVVLSTDAHGDVALSIDKTKIKAYMDVLNTKVGTPAGQTNIEIVDGIEIRRTAGAMGKAIDSGTVIDQIVTGLLAAPKQLEVIAPLRDIQPSVIFNSQYTATQAGLQAFINDTARTKNMHISIQQLTGEGWSVAARATESIPSASTYKLFLSLVLFDKIDKGEIRWEDPMLDTTVAGCFDRMTVASTNPCAEKWIAEFGREYINSFIYARGFSSGTSFTTGGANQTTAADLTKYMIGLNNGTLVSGANRDRLLNNLGRHPYRYGIPTGSAGSVNDKVGFLWDYVHDTAIVHHPRGTYIMTVMTKGQSYAAIASVTRSVERIMYP